MNDRKKVEKKSMDTSNVGQFSTVINSGVKQKHLKKGTSKFNSERDIKLEEEIFSEENNKINSNKHTTNPLTQTNAQIQGKYKKIIDINSSSSTPQSGGKLVQSDKGNSKNLNVNSFNSINNNKKKSIQNKTNNLPTPTNRTIAKSPTNDNKNACSPIKKYTSWSQNPLASNIISNLDNYFSISLKDNLHYSFKKIFSIVNNEFFIKLQKLKREMNEILNTNNQSFVEYHPFLLRFMEGGVNQINSKLIQNQNNSNINQIINNDYSNEDNLRNNLNLSTLSDDGLINYVYYKNNSVAFEIPLKRERAMSDNEEKSSTRRDIHHKLSNRMRMASEEIEKRMKAKLENAQKLKENIKLHYQENITKLMNKISNIKQRRKKEKQENLQKLTEKLERYNLRHQKILDEKISKVKSEHEKVAEINFLNRMEKENKDLSIIKKLNISIERRENYMMKKLNKTIERNNKEKLVGEKRETVEREFKNKVLRKLEKNNKKKEEAENPENGIKIDNKHELVCKRKILLEDRIEFLKNVYSENFIWELLEADYFDVDDLLNLTNITKFEIVKAKLKKDKEFIDKIYDKNNEKSKLSCKTTSNTSNSKTKIINESDAENLTNNCKMTNYLDIDHDGHASSDKEENKKRSKSFTYFDENDFLEVDYLFKDTNKVHRKKTKKKKKPEKIKEKIIKSISSMSQTDFNLFFSKINKDRNIKRYLIKSKNGRYIKSKLIVKNEEINLNPNTTEISNLNNNNNNLHQILSDNEYSDKDISLSEEKKEKLMKNIALNTDMFKNYCSNNIGTGISNSSNTILINSESLSNILEKNSITLKWCKLCNLILPNDQDALIHIYKPEHKKLKIEYGISLQDDSTFIMVFQSLPGDISEDLKNERINAIKLRFKKVKQKLLLKAVKHENFWTYRQDFPSSNKQRLQKISFDIEKQVFPNIKDYESLDYILKDLIKILEQKKQNDLHIMRQLKVIHCLVEILKKPAVCHKSEIKNLGKIIDLVVKVLMYFSTIIENRNYMVVTNRISVVADLLLWVLNKPSKIPLGISFLPDTIYLITIHIKHRIPFEYLSMKDDFIEYMFLSNILVKFRQKYTSLVGPIDLTSGFGSFPLVLLKSLGMIEALTNQININYCSKPVYVKNSKISENILFVLEHTELVGIIQLLITLLLSNGPIKPKSEKDTKGVILPQTVVSASNLAVKVLNNIARLDLSMLQNVCSTSLLQEQLYHIFNYIINYSLEYSDTSDDLKELLHETILMMNYCCLLNEKIQNILSRGEVTVVQKICSLPFSYFCEKKLKDILFPTLISISYKNDRNVEIMNKEINLEMLIMFLKEKIQLEPIIEEEEMDRLDESREEINFNMIAKDQFINLGTINSLNNIANNEGITGLKKRTMSFSSTASSTKSCHDMLTGVSDYIYLHHRFPRNLWEKALDYYSNFGKNK